MSTPMYEMEKFLETVRDTASEILKDHREWFQDESRFVSPDAHYESVDYRICCLASMLAHKAERIKKERAQRGVAK